MCATVGRWNREWAVDLKPLGVVANIGLCCLHSVLLYRIINGCSSCKVSFQSLELLTGILSKVFRLLSMVILLSLFVSFLDFSVLFLLWYELLYFHVIKEYSSYFCQLWIWNWLLDDFKKRLLQCCALLYRLHWACSYSSPGSSMDLWDCQGQVLFDILLPSL